jgi:transporter family protein
MWLSLGLISALFLGMYDVSKKHAVHQNAVLPVLFLATLTGACLMLPLLVLSRLSPELLSHHHLLIPSLTWDTHALIGLKSLLVGSSWICAYFALKHLPISLAAPIRASAPVWTLLGALLIFHERLNSMEWSGLLILFLSYYAFSLLGAAEGIAFHRNRWIPLIFLGTLLGAGSGLYDKFLLQRLSLPPVAVQAWFSLYLALILGLVLLTFWLPHRHRYTPFVWRWSIPLIGILLIMADFAYFKALSEPGVLITLLSSIRRSSVIVAFVGGGLLFREKNKRWKALALAGVLAGIALIILAH